MQKLHSGITTLSVLGASKHGFVGRRVDPYGMMIRATTQHTHHAPLDTSAGKRRAGR